MPRFSIEELTAATGGVILQRGGRKTVNGVRIDSRKVTPGELFVPIIGERHDAHVFIPQAVERGSGAILAQRDRLPPGLLDNTGKVWVIGVEDSTRALGDLAAFHRRKFKIPLVAVTGSSGKTTTKDMTAAALGKKAQVHKTEGNLNNYFGLPLTLFHMNGQHRASVVEMGMNRPGEIKRLTEISCPSIGVITNVGPVHLEFLGTVTRVRDAKAEMAEVMAERGDGILVLNADDPHGRAIADRFNRMLTGRIVLFGQNDAANVKAMDIEPLGTKGIAFSLRMGKEHRRVRLRTPGKHNVSNALAAAAVAWTLGCPADDVVAGLESFRPSPMRMQIIELPKGLRVINDAYNANPDSMAAALETFASMANGGQTVAVLGDMLELGKRAVSAHRSVGAAVARLSRAPKERIDHLVVVGKKARLMADEALKRGMPSEQVTVCESHGEATRWLKRHTRPGDWVLLKGSRGMGMERVLDGLAPQNTRGSKKRNSPTRKAKRSA